MKLHLAHSLKNRDSTTDKDAKLLNGYAEIRKGSLRVFKRPSLSSAFELTPGGGQGIFVPEEPDGPGDPIVIIDDIATVGPTPLAKSLSFTVQPTTSNIGEAISPAVVVKALTANGDVATSYTDDVTIAFFDNPTGATLGGTVTVAAVSGVATFSNLTVNRSGQDFSFIATSGNLNPAYSNSFSIPTQLAFTVQPSGVEPNTTFSVTVAAQDNSGDTDTRYSGFISIAIYSGAGGALGGNLQRLAVNGEVTFPDLTIDVEGTYTLVVSAERDSGADCYTPASRVSNTFQVIDSTHTFEMHFDGLFTCAAIGANGDIVPLSFNGVNINVFYSDSDTPENNLSFVSAVAPDFFTSITINGVTLLSADAVHSGAEFAWPTAAAVTSAGSYPVTIV